MYKLLIAIATAVCIAGVRIQNQMLIRPGEEKSNENKLNTGADLLQDKILLKAFNAYLDGFHFYNGNVNAQWRRIITSRN